MLLIHGITTYSFIWEEVLPYLSQHYEVIVVDLLGCGDSDKPLEPSYSLKSHAERLLRFLDALGCFSLHLVGHDLGGGVAQIMAVDQPERLKSLSLVNSVAHDYWPVKPISLMRVPILRQLVMASLDIGIFRLIVKRGLYHSERCDDQLMEQFFKPMLTREGRKAFLHFAHSLDNHNLIEIHLALASLSLPTLIIRGQEDLYLGGEIATFLHRVIPHSDLIRVENAGHFIQVDQPEQLAQLILEFTARNG